MAAVSYSWLIPSGDTQVNDTITAGNQTDPAIGSTTSGRFFVAWSEPALHPVDGRVFLPDGSALGSQFYVNSTGANNQYEPSVASLANGNFVVTFRDTSLDPSGGDIRVRFFDQNGNPPGNDFRATDGPAVDVNSDVAALADGGFVVGWTRVFNGGTDIDTDYRVFNADGSARGSTENYAEHSSNLNTYDQQVAGGLTGGGFVIAWVQETHGVTGKTVWFKRFDADGDEVAGSLKQVGGTGAFDVQIAGLKDGGFAVAYTHNVPGSSSTEIRLQLYNADGSERPSDPNPVGTLPISDYDPSLTVLSNGDIVVGWVENNFKRGLQAYDPHGIRLGANAFTVPYADQFYFRGQLAALTGGLVATVYESTRGDDSQYSHSIRSTISELVRTITGDGSSETLVGDSLRDVMHGNGGDDTLIGGGGPDALDGGEGNDTYVLGANASGLASVADPGGIDTITSTIDRSLLFADYSEIENLTLLGGISGVGNTLANIITGNASNNALVGNDGNDTLNGGAGNDTLIGGPGFDRLVGGPGNDTYVLGNDANAVVDTGGSADLVTTTISRSLMAPGLTTIERLTLLSGNINGTGNNLANTIIGSAGNNILQGGLGNDTLLGGAGNDTLYGGIGIDRLTGGAGKDVFVFNVAPTLANRDTITDFSHVDDTIKLSHSYFKGMGTGPLKPTFFFAGTHAHDADDHVIYNKATGALYYDSDGTGAHAQVLFAVVTNHATAGLAFSDFVLV